MALFTPETIIYFLKDTGVDDYNKPYFDNDAAMYAYMQGKTAFAKTGCSYQRGDERQYCAVNINYYDLQTCDYMMWQNSGTSTKWLYARITGLEWKNPNLTWVYFEVDAFCSFCGQIDWSKSYCFVEREHVENDWNGIMPNWANIGVPESFSLEPDTIDNNIIRKWTPDRYAIISPYDNTGDVNFNGTIQFGIYNGLYTIVVSDAQAVNDVLQTIADSSEAKLDNVLGVYSFPSSFMERTGGTEIVSPLPWVKHSEINNAKCFSSQFCTISVETMMGGSVNYKPELFTSGTIQFNFNTYLVGATCGFTVVPEDYCDLMPGSIVDLGLSYEGMPQGAFVGNAFAEYLVGNKIAMLKDALSSLTQFAVGGAMVVGAGIGAASGIGAATAIPLAQQGITNIGSGLSTATNTLQNIAKARKSSATVGGKSSGSDINLAVAADGYGYAIRVYLPQMAQLQSVDDYFSRFGYAVNRIKVPNVNSRPLWNYVKCVESHVAGDMTNNYRRQIEELLNNGVTFWHTSACEIGDYSDLAGNKG